MTDLSSGGRRTLGLVTLGLAVLLTAGWVRSFRVRDVFSFHRNGSMITFRSFDGGLGLQQFSPAGALASTGWRSDFQFKFSVSDPWWRFDNFDEPDIEWRWEWAGFSVGSANKKDPPILRKLAICVIPYWALVTPMAAISARLLLTTSRRAASAPRDLTDEERERPSA